MAVNLKLVIDRKTRGHVQVVEELDGWHVNTWSEHFDSGALLKIFHNRFDAVCFAREYHAREYPESALDLGLRFQVFNSYRRDNSPSDGGGAAA